MWLQFGVWEGVSGAAQGWREVALFEPFSRMYTQVYNGGESDRFSGLLLQAGFAALAAKSPL
jgi:hypothetical protein